MDIGCVNIKTAFKVEFRVSFIVVADIRKSHHIEEEYILSSFNAAVRGTLLRGVHTLRMSNEEIFLTPSKNHPRFYSV